MIFNVTEKSKIHVAEFAELKRFTLATTEGVKEELRPILSVKGAKLILSLKNIEFIDSSAIGCIISLAKTAKLSGSYLKISDLCEQVTYTFNLLHLHMLFEIENDAEAAIISFKK